MAYWNQKKESVQPWGMILTFINLSSKGILL